MERQRSLSQRLSSSVLDPLKRQAGLQHSRVASESFISSSSSGTYKGQIVGSPSKGGNVPPPHTYLNHDDINRNATHIFYTEGAEDNNGARKSILQWFLTIIHPYDRFKRGFDLLTVFWVLLLVYHIPFEIGFDWYETPKNQKILFTVLDLWFAVDIILNFRTGYLINGTVVMDPKKIASNYLSTWFLVDVLGTLPFELMISGSRESRKSLKLVKYFKIPKLLRVSRVLKFLRNHKYVYDFSKVLLVMFTALHVGACLWVGIIDPCDETKANYSGVEVCEGNVYHVYSEALHISATMILGVSNAHIVGNPQLLNIDFERRDEDSMVVYLVSTAYMIVGLFLIALLISETSVYVMGKMQGSAAFQMRTDRVNHEMEYYGVPDDLQRQVRAFYDYVWIHQKQYDEKIALLSDQQMSTDLQRKLALHLFKDVVSHISFFSEIDDLLLGEICMSLKTRIFLPGDMILFKGDVGKELFIIAKGVVEVLRDDLPANKRRNAPRITLTSGSFFGEIALVMEVRRTCSVQARTVCEVNILQQDAFDAVVRQNPHFARRINELVVARQLVSQLASSKQEGVDFRVAQTDIDLAVTAMEQSMREGLERRQTNESRSTATTLTDSSHRSVIRSNDTTKNKVASPMRVSFEDTPSVRAKLRSSDSKSYAATAETEEEADEESQHPVSDVLKDIARRSTRFQDESSTEKMRRNSADICSDGEIIEAAKKDRERVLRRRHTPHPSTAKVDDVDSHLTGHFNPGAVDISRIRPVILNNQAEEPRGGRDVGDVKSLTARLSMQSKLMEQLMAKIDRLDRHASSDESEEQSSGGTFT